MAVSTASSDGSGVSRGLIMEPSLSRRACSCRGWMPGKEGRFGSMTASYLVAEDLGSNKASSMRSPFAVNLLGLVVLSILAASSGSRVNWAGSVLGQG